MVDWYGISLTSFKRARDTTTVHMAHFITKYMSNTLSTMTILKLQVHVTTNLCPCCGLDMDTIQHLYQYTNEGSSGRHTVSVDALRKCIEAWNTDPDINIVFVDAHIYIAGERKLPTTMSKSNSTLRHPSHRLDVHNFRFHFYIPHRHTTNVFQSHRKQKTGLKWSIQLITQIWKLIYGQWIYNRKLKHVRGALGNHTKELILKAKITDKHKQGQDTQPYRYNPYFGTSLSTVLYTSITARKQI